jgi:RND family efflux transporter MFP subunit
MNRNYKYAFLIAALGCLVFGSALAYVAWSGYRPGTGESSPVVARGPEAAPSSSSSSSAPSMADHQQSSSVAPLTAVQLSPERMRAIGVKTALVETQTVSNEVRVPGNVDVNEGRVAVVQTRFPGWIQQIFAKATYQYVRKGQPLFTVYSPELVSTEQEYLLAKQNQQSFSQDFHEMRAPATGARPAGTQTTGLKESGWLLEAAADRLRQFGVPASEIARLEKTGAVQHDITIESPASGYITEFNALPNQYVDPGAKLYAIADLSSVWVHANVPQTDIGQLKSGTPAMVMVDAYPGRMFRGRIDQILPQVDPMTRTVPVRFVFRNPGVALMPGMFVNVSMSIPLGRQLVIPASGVLQAGTRQVAFIDRGGGYLEPREVEVGPRLDDHVVVLKGLREGERIVSSANFLLDSESQLQAAIASFAPPPSSAPGEDRSAASPPAQQAGIEFNSDPSPPRKGNNLLRVKLTGADGKPIAGAQVSLIFYMPAMPAMGMAAIRKEVTLAGEGNGVYQGSLQLESGGTYQVRITVQREGATFASKQLTVTAAGGM